MQSGFNAQRPGTQDKVLLKTTSRLTFPQIFCAAANSPITICSMADLSDQLLEATIRHVRGMKARGAKFVAVKPENLAALKTAAAKPQHAPSRTAPRATTRTSTGPLLSVTSTTHVPAPAAKRKSGHEDSLSELRSRVIVCQNCPHLARSRKSVVFGVGDPKASLMFVGEAPGADEDEQGEPFVGKAGQLLTKIIQAMEFSRDTVFIANILKCRPDTPGQSAGNRKPTPEEMNTCLPYLLAQIDIIKPKVIVALGATAVEGLLGKTLGITKLRGHFREFHGIPLMPTYHPAYMLRNQSMAIKREVWEDMLQVLEKLERPISAKMRNYFKSSKLAS
jgi:DNA polymerase